MAELTAYAVKKAVCGAGLCSLLLLVVGCGGGGGGIAPSTLIGEQEQAARKLIDNVNVTKDSVVYFRGPVKPGTEMRTDDLSNRGVGRQAEVLRIPDTPGNYYAYYIDDQPGFKFSHPVRYAWVNLETDEFEMIDADQPPVISEPEGGQVLPSSPDASGIISGIPFTFSVAVGGEGQAIDVSDKPDGEGNVNTDGNQNASEEDGKKYALVLDAGDKFHWLRGAGAADDMAADADKMEEWLKASDYSVTRRSQYWENEHRGFGSGATPGAMEEGLRKMLNEIRLSESEECSDGPCHELFLYISAHGNTAGFAIYGSNSKGKRDFVRYDELKVMLAQFSDCWRIVIFMDSCHSGAAIDQLKNLRTNDSRCGLVIMTSSDAANSTPSGQGLTDSATEDFMEGADEDHNNNGKKGDLEDRYEEMRRQGQGHGNPQIYTIGG